MSTEFKHRILRVISVGPQPLRFFTESDSIHRTIFTADCARRFADELIAAGLVIESEGRMHITAEGEAELAKKPAIAPLRTHCNASMPNWVAPKWQVARAGAEQHKQYRSRGY